jgi:hypothetical protein
MHGKRRLVVHLAESSQRPVVISDGSIETAQILIGEAEGVQNVGLQRQVLNRVRDDKSLLMILKRGLVTTQVFASREPG